MKKSLAFAASLVIVAGSVLPALAADDGLGKAVDGSLLLNRTAGVGAALVVGTPISVIRHTTRSYIAITEKLADKVGGHDFGPSCALVSLASFPAAVVIGGAKGIYGGTKTAVTKGFDTPFHPDSFSTGKMEE